MSLAFGGSKPKKSSSSKKVVISPANQENSVNSEEWQKRDKNFVDGAFENELKEAILASKIEFEENSTSADVNGVAQNETETNAAVSKKKSGNKKGTTTMSLDQFNHVLPVVLSLSSILLLHLLNRMILLQEEKKETKTVKAKTEDSHFFDEVTAEADKLISVEKNLKAMRKKKSPTKPKEVSNTINYL